jgi:hypothetical protein
MDNNTRSWIEFRGTGMSDIKIIRNDIAQRGQEIYQQQLRRLIETEVNIGKIVVIDVDTGDYEIADEGLTAGKRLLQRHPDAAMLCLRIGYDAVYSLGGDVTRTKL